MAVTAEATTFAGQNVHGRRMIGRITGSYDAADNPGNETGCCAAQPVSDDPGLSSNDPALDLMDVTPDNRFMVTAFCSPAPVSVQHSAQGSCPGVGIVALSEDGSQALYQLGKINTAMPVDQLSNRICKSMGGHISPEILDLVWTTENSEPYASTMACIVICAPSVRDTSAV